MARTLKLRLGDAPHVEWQEGMHIVRDDLHPGGSKARFLPRLIPASTREVVFGGPFCGGAPVALAYVAQQLGIKCTLFYAERSIPHRRQQQALDYGATIHWVPMGFINHVQKRARDYAENKGALFFPLGFDLPAARAAYIENMQHVRKLVGDVPEVWAACSTGMLTSCLAEAFPLSTINACIVGLKSRWEKQSFPSNVALIHTVHPFVKGLTLKAPFPICPNYEAKVWELAVRGRQEGALFWNVIGA
jgi:hypothetical protein